MAARNFKLLVVEDSESYSYLVARMLGEVAPAVTVITRRNAQEALEVLRSEEPDVVMLDLVMPSMSGFEFLRALRSTTAGIGLPVVVLTAYTDDQNIWGAYQEHANAVLVKPETLDELRALLTAFNKFWFGCVRLPSARP